MYRFFYRFSKKSLSTPSKFSPPPSWIARNGQWASGRLYVGRWNERVRAKKVWCSRLGSTKTNRFRLLSVELSVELRFLQKFHDTPFYMHQQLLLVHFLFLGNVKRWTFSCWKQDFICRVVRSPRARCTCTRNRLVFFWLTNESNATLLSGIAAGQFVDFSKQ